MTMGEIEVGTASWTDKTLLESGWYPQTADNPEKRLAYYARQFPVVEVDSTYYGPPAEQTTRLWARAHAGRLHLQHQGVQPADRPPDQGVRDLQGPAAGDRQEERLSRAICRRRRTRRSGPGSSPRWTRSSRPASSARCCSSSRRGSASASPTRSTCSRWRARCKPLRPVFEFRNASWFDGANRDETLDFLRAHQLPFVCVDMPQGHKSSVPPVVAATADLAVVRFHGHSDKWTSKDIHEKFGYHYSRQELRRVGAAAARSWPTRPTRTQVFMNNCYSDYAQRNATTLIELLGED